MANPWAVKAVEPADEWSVSSVAPLAKPQSKAKDVAKSGGSGLLEGIGGIVQAMNPAGLFTRLDPLNVGRTVQQVAPVLAGGIAQRLGGDGARVGGIVNIALGGNPASSQRAFGLYHEPETTEGRYARTVGQFASGAALGTGGIIRRGAQVVLPALASEGAADAAKGLGAGEQGQQAARIGGMFAGAVASGLRSGQIPPTSARASAVLGRKAGGVDAIAEEAARLRAAGIDPSLTDVIGETGRRFVRAVGAKSPAAGAALVKRQRTVTAGTKPAVMDTTRKLTGDARTADQVAVDTRAARGAAADEVYPDLYKVPVPMTNALADVVVDGVGQTAVRRARAGAEARMDREQVAEFDAILGGAPPASISAGALDRIRIAMRERGKLATQRQAGDMASGLNKRVGLIDEVLNTVEGIKPARADFAAKSQAIGILEGKRGARKDVFNSDPADYGAWVESLGPEAKRANAVAVRQEILDTLGGQRASTVGSIDELATSRYARENLAHALGDEAAATYLTNLEARLEQARHARFVSPNDGSRTEVLKNDVADRVMNALDLGATVARGDKMGLVQRGGDFLRRIGVPEKLAIQIAEDASDPAKLDAVIDYLRSTHGEAAANTFLQQYGRALAPAAIGGATAMGLHSEQRR